MSSNVKLEGRKQKKVPLSSEEEHKKLKEIFLIRKLWNGTGIVYKVFLKGEYLYFCKVKKTFQNEGIESKYNPEAEEGILLEDKHNFKLDTRQIITAVINIKKGRWIEQTPSNGTVTLFIGGQKEKYTIHSYQDARTIYNFFRSILGNYAKLLNGKQAAHRNSFKKYKASTYGGYGEYKSVKKKTEILNIIGTISGLWMLFYAKPYVILTLINTVVPLAAVFLYIKYKYVEFATKEVSDIPSIQFATISPSFALSLTAFSMKNLVCKKDLWIYIATISLLIFIIILLMTEEYRKKKRYIPINIICMILMILMYVYGAFIVTNQAFDTSKPVKYTAYVDGKSETVSYRGGNTTYYLILKPWGPFNEKNYIAVPKYLQDKTRDGQEFNILLMKGRWGIRWVKAEGQ